MASRYVRWLNIVGHCGPHVRADPGTLWFWFNPIRGRAVTFGVMGVFRGAWGNVTALTTIQVDLAKPFGSLVVRMKRRIMCLMWLSIPAAGGRACGAPTHVANRNRGTAWIAGLESIPWMGP